MKISDNTSVSMPMRNLIAICGAIIIGTMAFFSIQERINNLETRATLFEADLVRRRSNSYRSGTIYVA